MVNYKNQQVNEVVMEDFIKGLAERVLEGEKLSKEDGLKILSIPDEYLDLLVQEASKVREAVLEMRLSSAHL